MGKLFITMSQKIGEEENNMGKILRSSIAYVEASSGYIAYCIIERLERLSLRITGRDPGNYTLRHPSRKAMIKTARHNSETKHDLDSFR